MTEDGAAEKEYITGEIVSGQKKAAGFTALDWVRDQCREKLGFDPYPGTLNLKLDSRSRDLITPLLETPGPSLVPPDKNFCEAGIRPVDIQGINAAIILPSEDVRIHGPEIIEILAPCNLKQMLGVDNGDSITVFLNQE